MKSTVINGIKIYDFSSRKALIEYAFLSEKSLIAINAEKILHADTRMRELININIGFADGIGVVWALRRKGFKDAIKIPGCELWMDIVRSAYQNKTFYLVGGKQEVIDAAVSKLQYEFAGIQIVNYHNGYFGAEEEKCMLIDDLAKRKPDVVFVAMGSPNQELLIEQMQNRHTAVYQGLGGSFDVYTGYVKRAPDWWVRNNLEWAYRLVRQPSRIKRQLFLIKFLLYLLLKKF
jgi:UDP-N-acetyl-D-mannosaminouronate:lipid I N-acetyl-D-mannosaminouronosyltransferase